MTKRKQPAIPASPAGASQAGRTPRAFRHASTPWRRWLFWTVAFVVLPAFVGGAVTWAVGTLNRPAAIRIVYGDGKTGPLGMAWVPGGEFLMGSDYKMAQLNERPAHKVRVHGFWMDEHHVTNAEFRKFVAATGYMTTAEKKPDWETLKVQLPPGTPQPP
ncbi:MAG: SUMF1/EgtB/PvdO family nonheme iron enzyme, partial [Paraburkholderia sp.]